MSDIHIKDYGTGRGPKPGEKTWKTTEELLKDFEVLGFSAPYVSVRRRSDNQCGTLEFTHHPRVYFDFVPTS